MKILFLGNFGPYTQESKQAELLESKGNIVYRLQESDATAQMILECVISQNIEAFIWIHTAGWKTKGGMHHPIRVMKDNGVVVIIGSHHPAVIPMDITFERRLLSKEYAGAIPLKELARVTLFRAGDLPNSAAGVFNPSAVMFDGRLHEIFRKEKGWLIFMKQYDGGTSVPHIAVKRNRNELVEQHGNRNFVGDYEVEAAHEEAHRWEDYRIFVHQKELWVAFKVVVKTNPVEVRQAIGRIINQKLVLQFYPELPIELNKIECNWCYFSEDNRLYCIYSLRPYIVFYIEPGSPQWKRHHVETPAIKWLNEDFICNSTNPILIGDYYLMFFHTKIYNNGTYLHGAVLIDRLTKEIAYATPNCLKIEANMGGWHKVIYVSSALYIPERNVVRVYYGEGDMNACYNEYDKNELFEVIMRQAVFNGKENAVEVTQKLQFGWCTAEKATRLYELVTETCRTFENPVTVEAGVFGGKSLFPMAMAHRDNGKGYAYGIDAWSNEVAQEGTNSKENNDWWSRVNLKEVYGAFLKFLAESELGIYCQFYRGKTVTAATLFADNSVTLFHQDSNHSSEVILQELELWIPKLRSGGYWVVDDTNWESTKEGYSKLPEFGLTLVEQHDTWAVYKKQ